jgi:ubiquinone biosynthesis protein
MVTYMGIRKKTQHLKRYRDLAGLLVKYGRSDIVKQLDLETSDLPKGEGKDPLADELPDDLERLGPTYIKLGQFLSTRADFFPPEYLKALSRLQDKVAPIAEGKVETIVASELGTRISKAFDHFEIKPVASASLGQVHFAKLRGGRPVAVKVQRPDIREQIFTDLDAFDDIAEFLEKHTKIGRQLMLHATLEEFRKAMVNELDYWQEAQNLRNLSENLKEFTRIRVPLPVQDYTTSRILTMEYLPGKNIGNISPLGLMDIDGEVLAEELFRAYLKQILVDGFFHADPHPGNVYVTDDGNLALIDLGMVARVPEKLKMKLVRILIAISEGEGDKAAGHLIDIGEKEDNANEADFTRMVSEVIAKTHDNSLQQIEVGRLVLEVTRISADNGIRLPNEIIMLGKALLNLDRVGRTLDPDFDPNASLRRNTVDLMQKKLRGSLRPSNFYESLLDAKDFIENFPGRVNKVLSALADNKFTLRMRIIDEEHFIGALKEAANRLTTGLILAALIIGAALMMRIETGVMIMGYPALAIIFFLIAALGGLILVFRAMFRDR